MSGNGGILTIKTPAGIPSRMCCLMKLGEIEPGNRVGIAADYQNSDQEGEFKRSIL